MSVGFGNAQAVTGPQVQSFPVTIANGQTVSGSSGDLGMLRLTAIRIPSGWDTTISISLLESGDGVNFNPLQDETGTLYSVPIAAAPVTVEVVYRLLGSRYLKVVAASVVTGDQIVTLVVA